MPKTETLEKEAGPQEAAEVRKQQRQTPATATANMQPRKEQTESRKRSRTEKSPKGATQQAEKRQCRGGISTEGDKTCQPGLPPKKTEKRKDTEQKQGQKREHAT